MMLGEELNEIITQLKYPEGKAKTNAAIAEWSHQYKTLTFEFKEALFKLYKIETNPKREDCYELAMYFASYSSDYSTYEFNFMLLADLIRND